MNTLLSDLSQMPFPGVVFIVFCVQGALISLGWMMMAVWRACTSTRRNRIHPWL